MWLLGGNIVARKVFNFAVVLKILSKIELSKSQPDLAEVEFVISFEIKQPRTYPSTQTGLQPQLCSHSRAIL